MAISFAGAREDRYDFRVDESSINHVVVGVEADSPEVHHSVADDDTLQVNLASFSDIVVGVNQHSQIGDILAGIGFAGDEESTAFILWELVEEVDNSIEVVICC